MNEDLITTISREYAEELSPENKINREMIELDCMGFLSRVLNHFCLVEKSRIQEEFREAKSFLDVATPLAEIEPWSYYTGRKIALKHLFPEIAKEVE